MSLPLAALVPILAAAGAPLLKRLAESVGGRTGGAVADVVIDSLAREIGTKPTVDAIAAAYDKDPARTVEAIGRVEVQRREDWAVMLAEVNQTMRAEQTAPGLLTRIWRPLFGILYGVAFLALALAVTRAVWNSDVQAINAVASVSGLLIAFYGTGAGVLGVYAWGRTREKIEGATR
ncbi:MAG: hypothetical protein CML67_02070 [Rhodobacteraceae bacterium]|nr:hypothetical protein [Paracoccaceae bacterium]